MKKIVPALFRRFFLAWFTAILVEFLLLPETERSLSLLTGLSQMSFFRVIGITTFLCLLFMSTPVRFPERPFILLLFMLLSIVSLKTDFSFAYLAVLLLVILILTIYSIYGWDHSSFSPSIPVKESRIFLWLTILFSVLFCIFVSIWTVCRVYSFCTPTFDFGLFSQMFYYLKTTGLPLTTLERDGLLSHFNVHVSPVYYLFLPFYLLFPEPAFLQVLQAVVITSAVIPLWKLGKLHGLLPFPRMLFCVLLLLYPAFSGGTGYDLHENCFLTPFILWLFYGIDRRNTLLTILFAILTLTVKEDAAVYVAVIALWLTIKTLLGSSSCKRKELITGLFLLALSIIYFLLTTGYLARSGDGVMTYRYDNFFYKDSDSLFTVIQAVFLCPLKVLYECVDPEKWSFLAWTLLPLFGLSFFTRRYERYLLLIPYILINLMSDYQYQHDIFFQYTFGSTAFLFYLSLVNLAEWKINYKKAAVLIFSAIISIVCFSRTVVPKAMKYPEYCSQSGSYYSSVRSLLSQIPQEASVAATTFYTTYLSQRPVLYDVRHCSREHLLSCEYIVLKTNETNSYKKYAADGENGYENLVELLLMNGYELMMEYRDVCIYHIASE